MKINPFGFLFFFVLLFIFNPFLLIHEKKGFSISYRSSSLLGQSGAMNILRGQPFFYLNFLTMNNKELENLGLLKSHELERISEAISRIILYHVYQWRVSSEEIFVPAHLFERLCELGLNVERIKLNWKDYSNYEIDNQVKLLFTPFERLKGKKIEFPVRC